MNKIDKLNRLINQAEEFLGKNLTSSDSKFKAWNNSLIRFSENEYGEKSVTTNNFKRRSYSLSFFFGNTPHSDFVDAFESDLKTTIEDLKFLLEEVDDDYTKKESIKTYKPERNFNPINVNITNSNNNTNMNSNVINIFSIDEIKKDIEDNTYLDDDSKEKLYQKLNEIEELQQSNESKSKKWNKAKKILEFVLDKGADIAIMFIPQILAAITK